MSVISVTTLTGVGPKCAERLAQLNIVSIQDLLLHLPLRYEDRSRVHAIAELKHGDHVLIEGRIIDVQTVGARRYLRCTLQDVSQHRIDLVFFFLTKVHEKNLSQMKGLVRCFGEVRRGFTGHLEMTHPEYALVQYITKDSILTLSPCLSPVYSTTKGLQQITWRKLMRQALQLLQHDNILPELMPDTVLQQFNLFSLHDALQWIHFPPLDVCLPQLLNAKHPAQQRLIMEELIAHQLRLQGIRQTTKTQSAFSIHTDNLLQKQFLLQLPFELTRAQTRVIAEIEQDLIQSSPMLRLVQGDVGSGKTVVACVAALTAIESGYQAALMAPTEILSEQHYQTISKWFSSLNISVGLLTGRQTAAEQKIIKSKIMSGEIQFIVGTHALFQQDVAFKNCALFIIDEQHRFGVQQRLALMEKGLKAGVFPHQLIMTATPIPRTLTMTAYADLDVSIIDELPVGRKPITTALISCDKRDEIIARVQTHCEKSTRQAYWVCTLIDESEVLQCQAAETTAQHLQAQLKGLRVGLVHGRLPSEEKNAVMRAFQSGDIDLLVATTVIEVGVDVANASLMVIENPERLGLAQLHQLRGRVGRGSEASFCVLLYQHPLSEITKKRLSVMRESQNGFFIAEQDLAIRGPGDVLGVRQSGVMQWRVADLMRDQSLLPVVQKMAAHLLAHHPEVVSLLMQRWVGSEMKYLCA